MLTMIRVSLALLLALFLASASSATTTKALSGATEAKGTEAIRKFYADLLAANTVTSATFANTHYETSGNLSVGWGDFTLSMSPKAGGSPVSLSGNFSVIARKEGGKWSYVVDHASASPAPPAPY